jgi:8-oxo-dGTP pyrophosphatase MutT (NUDIX family)
LVELNPVVTELERRIVTAGAYVRVDQTFPFMVGPTAGGEALGVVRLGGHRERGESSWDCAAREVREEASIDVQPARPPYTYWLHSDDPDQLRTVKWTLDGSTMEPPLLVVEGPEAAGRPLSAMYRAFSDDTPSPAAETQGLLLMTTEAIEYVTSTQPTLRDYLAHGFDARPRVPLPLDLRLKPFLQLRVLARLLKMHPELSG